MPSRLVLLIQPISGQKRVSRRCPCHDVTGTHCARGVCVSRPRAGATHLWRLRCRPAQTRRRWPRFSRVLLDPDPLLRQGIYRRPGYPLAAKVPATEALLRAKLRRLASRRRWQKSLVFSIRWEGVMAGGYQSHKRPPNCQMDAKFSSVSNQYS